MPDLVLHVRIPMDSDWDPDSLATDLVWPVESAVEKEIGVAPTGITHEIEEA
ncbi:hypothetical protein KXR83_05650 [Williamsia muralis]|uniref:hypothetical protein n=1 Tax=Williamsia marianensis TaxID=85044 RepID=UPI003F158CA1